MWENWMMQDITKCVFLDECKSDKQKCGKRIDVENCLNFLFIVAEWTKRRKCQNSFFSRSYARIPNNQTNLGGRFGGLAVSGLPNVFPAAVCYRHVFTNTKTWEKTSSLHLSSPIQVSRKKEFFEIKNTFILTGNRALLEEKKIAPLFHGVHDLGESAAAEVEKSPLDRVGRWLWRRRRGRSLYGKRRRRMRFLSSSRETSIYHIKSNSVFIFSKKNVDFSLTGNAWLLLHFLGFICNWLLSGESRPFRIHRHASWIPRRRRRIPPISTLRHRYVRFHHEKGRGKGLYSYPLLWKKNRGQIAISPLFRARNAGESFFSFLVGSPFPPKKEEEGVFIAFLSLSLSLLPPLFLFFFQGDESLVFSFPWVFLFSPKVMG